MSDNPAMPKGSDPGQKGHRIESPNKEAGRDDTSDHDYNAAPNPRNRKVELPVGENPDTVKPSITKP